MNRVQIIQGGLYGSEAKGAVAAYLAVKERMDVCVRTGAVNAGHTCYFNGDRFVMQQLPVGWVNPDAKLVIGAGALIDPEILQREIDDIRQRTGTDVRNRLMVDPRAYLHWPQHQRRSAESNRHVLIGATGKGCSEAYISKLRLRGQEDFTIGAHINKLAMDIPLGDTEELLNRAWDEGARIQLEGTQGQLLDLHLGPYPYTTHKQTGPAQWMLECGLSPSLPTDIVMVVRTFPIRVAGNSGPLPKEISWPILAREINEQRADRGLVPIVSEGAICAFEESVRRVARSERWRGKVPGGDGLDQHMWVGHFRVEFAEALSHLHAEALSLLDDSVRDDLKSLFEMTTVTKKLRRVARLDIPTLVTAARQCRPNRVVMTFMNYAFPQLWADGSDIVLDEEMYIADVESACNAPVVLINRGPLPEHFVDAVEGDYIYRNYEKPHSRNEIKLNA